MFFQEPKVEFIELMLADAITTSGQGEIGQCAGNMSDEDCVGSARWNYGD